MEIHIRSPKVLDVGKAMEHRSSHYLHDFFDGLTQDELQQITNYGAWEVSHRYRLAVGEYEYLKEALCDPENNVCDIIDHIQDAARRVEQTASTARIAGLDDLDEELKAKYLDATWVLLADQRWTDELHAA